MIKSQKGYIGDVLIALVALSIFGLFALLLFSRWEWSADNVSGIVYNTTNDRVLSGATKFSVRAGENTPVDEDNLSRYCLPGNSPYKELVNRAAADKRIKVNVTTKKGFWVKAPWTCIDNVTVTEVK